MTPAGAQPLQSGSRWWRHLPLAWPLAKRDVLARYRGSFAGVLWALAAPLGMVLVYALVFQGVFKAPWAGREVGGLGYAMRLFAGLMVFSAVAEVAGRASRLIQDNANLVKRVVFPLELLSVSLVLQVSIHLLLQVLVLAALLIITGEGPHWRWLAWPVVLLWTLLLQVALAWLLTALGAYVRDLQHLVPVLFSGLLFLSPVFYPTHAAPAVLQVVLAVNPLSPPIDLARHIWFGDQLNAGLLAVQGGALVLGLLLAGSVFRRLRPGFADLV